MRKNALYVLVFSFFIAGFTCDACNFSQIPPELRAYVDAFKASEKLTLGEKIKVKQNKAHEMILRSRTKNWDAFLWKINPLEIHAIILAQSKYDLACEKATSPILSEMISDFNLGKVPNKTKKKFIRLVLLYAPCAGENETLLVQDFLNSLLQKNSEDMIDLIIATESEISLYKKDYTACGANAENKFLVSDAFLKGLDAYKKKIRCRKRFGFATQQNSREQTSF
jgi:hypothetical protein